MTIIRGAIVAASRGSIIIGHLNWGRGHIKILEQSFVWNILEVVGCGDVDTWFRELTASVTAAKS